MPSTMYNASVAEITSRMRSIRWKEPSTTTSEISTPATGALTQDGMPINEPAAEMPAYSAQIVPKLVNSKPITAT